MVASVSAALAPLPRQAPEETKAPRAVSIFAGSLATFAGLNTQRVPTYLTKSIEKSQYNGRTLVRALEVSGLGYLCSRRELWADVSSFLNTLGKNNYISYPALSARVIVNASSECSNREQPERSILSESSHQTWRTVATLTMSILSLTGSGESGQSRPKGAKSYMSSQHHGRYWAPH